MKESEHKYSVMGEDEGEDREIEKGRQEQTERGWEEAEKRKSKGKKEKRRTKQRGRRSQREEKG